MPGSYLWTPNSSRLFSFVVVEAAPSTPLLIGTTPEDLIVIY